MHSMKMEGLSASPNKCQIKRGPSFKKASRNERQLVPIKAKCAEIRNRYVLLI